MLVPEEDGACITEHIFLRFLLGVRSQLVCGDSSEIDVVPVFLEFMVVGERGGDGNHWRGDMGVKDLGLEGSQTNTADSSPEKGRDRRATHRLHGAMGASPYLFHRMQLPHPGLLCSAVTKSCVPRWEQLGHVRRLGVAILG